MVILTRTRRDGTLIIEDTAVPQARAAATKAGVNRKAVLEVARAMRMAMGMVL